MKKNSLIHLFTLFCVILTFSSITYADDPVARAIMKQVRDRDDGDNIISNMEMTLVDKNKKRRVRKIRSFTKDKGEDTYRIMFFLHPADVKNTGFLTYDYDDESVDDDQWLYLPALRKTKRIASNDKSGSFMGSDLNYSDMTSRNLDDYDFNLIKESEVNGHKVWIIQSDPRSKEVIDKTGYRKSILFIRQDNYVVVRSKSWTNKGGYIKYLSVKNLELIDGVWMATETVVTKKQGKKIFHQTRLKFSNIKMNEELDYGLFKTRKLESGL